MAEPTFIVAALGVLGTIGAGLIAARTGRHKNNVDGFAALSAAEARFREQITKRLDECEKRHEECEQETLNLKRRVAEIETKVGV